MALTTFVAISLVMRLSLASLRNGPDVNRWG